MNFEEALRVELSTICNKVFPLNAPEGTKSPFIVYVSSEGIQDKSLDGYLNSKEVECGINILHSNYPGMKDITRNVIEKLKTFQSRVIGEGPFIQNVTYENVDEFFDHEIALYRCVLNIKVKF